MTQHRFFNSGTPADAAVFKEMLTGLTGKTVLSGGDLGVAAAPAPTQPDRIVVQPIWLVLDSPRLTQQGTTRNNLLLYEDEPKQIVVPISSAAANYTLVYRHTDADVFGGNAATLALENGLLRNENITDGLVIGYVVYPGGAVGLTSTMLIPAPRARIEAVSSPADGTWLCPPFTAMVYAHTPAGPAPGVDTIDHVGFGNVLEINNASAYPTIDTLRWSFVCAREQPRNLTFDYVYETGQVITIDLEDTDGNVSSSSWAPTSTVLAGMLTSDFSQDYVVQTSAGQQLRRRRLRITNGTFTPGKRFRVQATIQTPAAKRTLIASVGHSTYRLPFAS